MIIIGERDALAWILTTERMAFPDYRAHDVADLTEGDELFLYTTRGCFHNPGRDRGRIIGAARAASRVERLEPPLEIAGRSFGIGCRLTLTSLAADGRGVELSPLVPQLDGFPETGWAPRLRRPLVPLSRRDAALLRRRLQRVADSPKLAVDEYVARAARRRGNADEATQLTTGSPG